MLQYQEFLYLVYPAIALLLIIPASAILGTLVVSTGISYIIGGIAHAIVGGLGITVVINAYFPSIYINPLLGALISAIIIAIILSKTHHNHHQIHEDATISLIWSGGTTIGIICIMLPKSPSIDLIELVTGNIFWISLEDICYLTILNIWLYVFIQNHWQQLYTFCFNRNIALMRKIDTESLYRNFIMITSLFIVMIVYMMGTLLAITIFAMPALSALLFQQTIQRTIIIASVISSISLLSGLLAASVIQINISAVISAISIAIYMLSYSFHRFKK